jgi:hypothetical protein
MYSDQDIANLVARVQQLEHQIVNQPPAQLPKIGLLSPNFLTRAFAVWGHYFVSSLLIGIAVSCVTVIISLILGTSALGFFQQLINSIK